MGKVRIHEIAKEIGLKSKEVIEKAIEININVKSASSAVTEDVAGMLMNYIINGVYEENKKSQVAETEKETKKEEPKKVQEKEKLSSKTDKEQKREQKITPDKTVETKEEIKKEKSHIKAKEKPKKESLAQASLKGRRGLVIVKKKRPKPVEKTPKEEITTKKTSTLSAATLTDMVSTRKKKAKKTVAVGKKEESKKLDILSNISFKEVEVENEKDMVVLPDLTNLGKEEDKEQKKKVIDHNKMRTTKKSPFLTQNIKEEQKGKKERRSFPQNPR